MPNTPSSRTSSNATPDASFYAEPRLVVHIDDYAIEAARRLYGELLPKDAALLDLMSSFRSHLPPGLAWPALACRSTQQAQA